MDARYPGGREYLTTMDPYMSQLLEEDFTGWIPHELQNGNTYWLSCFFELMSLGILACDKWLRSTITYTRRRMANGNALWVTTVK